MPGMDKRYRWLVVIAISAGLLSGGFLFWQSKKVPNQPPKTEGIEVVKQDLPLLITENTLIQQKIIYKLCGDSETFTMKPSPPLTGLTRAELQKVYPDWTIDKFDRSQILMHTTVDGLCREHANSTFIGLKDGYVTIFYGKPGPRAIVKEVTRISVQRLLPEDLQELRKGIFINDREELLRTLEGLQSK